MLDRLRRQMLVAMGLPSCWSGGAEPAAVAPIAPPPKSIYAFFDPANCGIDRIPETVCGAIDEKWKTCGTTAARLETFDRNQLFVTPLPNVRHFEFDSVATHGYSDEVADESGRLGCCYSACTKLVVGGEAALGPPPPRRRPVVRCVPLPPGGTTKPAATNHTCPASIMLDGALAPYTESGDQTCCYATFAVMPMPIRGRAARIDGVVATAPTEARGDWSAALDGVREVAPERRAALAAAWRDAARTEHASVAAFGALALRLMALGAPADLIAGAHHAALDEIRHAQIAFALAARFGGGELGPAAWPAAAAIATATDLRALAIETFADGCIGETVAALEAERAARAAVDPAIAAILRGIATDEARHAALGWSIVAWCVRLDPAIVALLAVPPATDEARDPRLAEHGFPQLAAIRADAMRGIVEPCLARLRG